MFVLKGALRDLLVERKSNSDEWMLLWVAIEQRLELSRVSEHVLEVLEIEVT